MKCAAERVLAMTGAVLSRRQVSQGALLVWLNGFIPPESGRATAREPGSGRSWRSDFPALAQSVNRHPLTYLDSAATTQRPTAVLEALVGFYRHENANPGAQLHTLARRAHERYEAARETAATFLNAAQSDEIVWVRGTTEGINLVASAWARPRLQAGDELLLSVAEHASNLLPWRIVAAQTGAAVRYIDVDDQGRILLEDLDRKLSSRTRLLAFSHVSNVVGYVNPAGQICARARAAGARVLIDAAQSAPHVALDVQALGCDFLVFSGHKVLGPMGIGVLWGRRGLLEDMAPYQSGSNMAHEIDLTSQEFDHAARKFGAGTPNVSGALGLAAALQYLRDKDRAAIEDHEAQLTRYALDELLSIPGLRLLGPREPTHRVPVFSFTLAQHSPSEVLRHLDSCGIAIRAGDLAALPLLKRLGVTVAARASCSLYTQREDIDRLCSALQRLTRKEG